MIDHEQYHNDGFAFMKIQDLIPSDKLHKFHEIADQACRLELNSETFQAVYSVLGKNNDPEWPFLLDLETLEEKIKQAQELDLQITQKWYESRQPPSAEYRDYFKELIKDFIRDFYPEIKEDFSNIKHQDAITLYLNGDFTNNHRDGQNVGRLCAILIYLTPEEQFTTGGELAVNGDHEDKINSATAKLLKPVRGNVAMLDFNNHNVFHEVRKMTGDYKRFCFLTFIWNTDKLPDHMKRA